jgi:hypothetical protein
MFTLEAPTPNEPRGTDPGVEHGEAIQGARQTKGKPLEWIPHPVRDSPTVSAQSR